MNKSSIMKITITLSMLVIVIFFSWKSNTKECDSYKIGSNDNSINLCIKSDYIKQHEAIPTPENTVLIEYLYPDMSPFSHIRQKITKKRSLQEASIKRIDLEIASKTGLLSKDSDIFRIIGPGEVIEAGDDFFKLKPSNSSLYDYHFWYESSPSIIFIGCVKNGRCTLYKSYSDKLFYKLKFSEELLSNWKEINSRIISEINSYLIKED